MKDRHSVGERIYARGTWMAKSAVHLGGEDDGFGAGTDLVVLRDADGRPYLPASSLAGACRNHLSRVLLETKDYRQGHEPPELHVLFGDDYQSLLTFHDAKLQGQSRVLVRDGVKIGLESRVAEDTAKYDFEVLPAGTSFEIEIVLTLFDKLPDYCAKRSNEQSADQPQEVTAATIKSCFRLLLESLKKGLALGAKTRRGLGAGAVQNWELRCLDMSKREALAVWLAGDPYSYVPSRLEDLGPALAVHETSIFEINATFYLDSSLLIRSQGEELNGPEFTHLSENGKALLTATSLTGALRHRAHKIANTISNNEQQSERLVEDIFGYVHEGNRVDPARASRLRIAEIELPGDRDRLKVQGRVSIDRFTGGALETALFDEAAYWPKQDDSQISLSVVLEDPQSSEVGLLLLAFKDLWLGDLAVGGETGVGRGVMSGRRAKLLCAGHSAVEMAVSTSTGETEVTGPDTSWLNHCVEQLRRDLINV